ncbi:2-C-methyl-D-erythritol 4-phosphate cytidylyltransferase [Naumannella cuiyingiana]|uniref:2-C-methyl-D-erythritol 4-phosphate cytidylyltransferase n=1 Tax=Naumannella cuiyingiana TaxID=1347891 RepID=A0A7Z0ILI2_9ACTN|nr:2-C-methyl-D-erythritol 4-phosphate cytidylyltransferase [Naumannella cuiyingiana]NYI71586.1 2-C-methyl-D-erythritol 4-phosphate cytidylyltransferase [Naumannella cuiyingiana]
MSDRSSSGPAVALVVAAGSGVRFGADRPKALVELAGRPLVAHAVAALAAGGVVRAVVTVPAGREESFAEALRDAPVPVDLVVGGAERQDSVRLGLARLADARGPILVHDAARPLVPPAVVAAVIDAVRAGADAVVPAVPVADSIRRIAGRTSAVVDRASLRAVQTPQGFAPQALRAGHQHVLDAGLVVTDDAAACEAAGHPVSLVEGSADSLKITTPADLIMAEAILVARG